MRVPPKTTEDYPPLLPIRTDYRNADAWSRVRAALDRPWVFDQRYGEDGQVKGEILCVDDLEWAEASPAEVLAALTAPEDGDEPSACGWDVVFLADDTSMQGAEPTLLAIGTDSEKSAAPLRIPALETPHMMHSNLGVGNMGFEDFAETCQ